MGTNERESIPGREVGKKSAFQLSKEPVVHGKASEDAHKYEATIGEEDAASLMARDLPAYEDLGSLPASYHSKSLFLIARDPRWLFSYWDIDWQDYAPTQMYDGKVYLKVYNLDGAEVYSTDIDPEARNWYISVSQGNATFYAEIGFVDLDGSWEVIARSNETATPADGIAAEAENRFATVPYHLAFQKMLDLVQSGMEQGESLLSALSRIQNEGRKLMFALGATPDWTDDQRRVLAALLGTELSNLIGLGSAEIDLILRQQLMERLSSESSSGLIPKGEIGAESSLFSAITTFGSWKEVSSWAEVAQSSWWSSWLSSWGGGIAQQAALGSWLASWGGAQQAALSSWLASWSGQEQKALGSWLASWGGVQGVQTSSWLSSWLASWPSAAGGGASETFWSSWVSSWTSAGQVGASWSAQPFGAPREFFMHVNAEVIFYGGTHPDAKVWVDGRQIDIKPDGTFRFHFKFPDGDYTIPIIAESPDGVERRSATLRFERGTARQGHVTATPQPAYLSAPMGAR